MHPHLFEDAAVVLMLSQVGEGEFGTVYKAQYLGTTVAVKVLKDDNAVAIGDFRWESDVLDQLAGQGSSCVPVLCQTYYGT
jgi:predicted Ser/Thr protein kinase